jgi:regulator of nucleoside diphosphate kinase
LPQRVGVLWPGSTREVGFMNAPFDLPPITLASCDYNRLLFTVMMGQRQDDPVFAFLLSELRRAEVCHPAILPEEVVSANCRVIYRVDDEPRTRAHLLVHPEDLTWPGAEVSVTTPLGAALIGLSVGDRMPYTEIDGSRHEVLVEGIGLRFLDDGLISARAPARPRRDALFVDPWARSKISH